MIGDILATCSGVKFSCTRRRSRIRSAIIPWCGGSKKSCRSMRRAEKHAGRRAGDENENETDNQFPL